MPLIHAKYTIFTLVMTGKYDEPIQTDETTIGGLLDELDKRYPGFKDVFIPPENYILNLRTMITVKRVGMPPFGVVDPNTEIKDGDVILFW
ncbi:MAG: MoaD/ThiS family protein [Candidatus Bathyarchaeia archaeon]